MVSFCIEHDNEFKITVKAEQNIAQEKELKYFQWSLSKNI